MEQKDKFKILQALQLDVFEADDFLEKYPDAISAPDNPILLKRCKQASKSQRFFEREMQSFSLLNKCQIMEVCGITALDLDVYFGERRHFYPTELEIAYSSHDGGVQILKGLDIKLKNDVCGVVVMRKSVPLIWAVNAYECMRSDVDALAQKYLQKGVQVSLPSRVECVALCNLVNGISLNQTLDVLARYGVDVQKIDSDKSWSLFCRDNEYPYGKGICRFIIRG